MKRGEIWWAELEPPEGRRPVLLLSRDEAYAVRKLVTVAPVTTKMRHIPSEVPLGLEDGLPKPCVVNLDTITTIAKVSLRDRLTTLCVFRSKSAGFSEQIGHLNVAVKGKCQVFVLSDSVSKAGDGAVYADRPTE